MSQDEFIFEYDSSGNLRYIVDEKTIVGYIVKESPSEEEVQKIIASISRNRRSITKIPKWITKINNILLGNLSSKITFRLLLLLYLIFFLINLINYSIHGDNINFQINFDFFSKLNSSQVLLGIILFFCGLIFFHEGFHILISLVQGVKVSRIGFKLKYGFVPMLYVRVFPTSYNLKKMNIAIAGLVADQFLLFLFSTLFLILNSEIIYIAMLLQVTLSIFNYNILFPSDFTQAVLSKINYLDFRKDSFLYLRGLLKGSNIDFKPINILKIVYSILFFVMILVLFLNMLFLIMRLI